MTCASHRFRCALGVAIIVTFAAACTSRHDSPGRDSTPITAPPVAGTVHVGATTVDPATLKVLAGDAVVFHVDAPGTARCRSMETPNANGTERLPALDTGIQHSGDEVTVRLTAAGTVNYACEVTSTGSQPATRATGSIVVEPPPTGST